MGFPMILRWTGSP